MLTPDLDHAEALGALNRVTAERDTARAVAVRLESHVALLTDLVRMMRDNPEPGRPWACASLDLLDEVLARVSS